jgi:hypothetical protein
MIIDPASFSLGMIVGAVLFAFLAYIMFRVVGV